MTALAAQAQAVKRAGASARAAEGCAMVREAGKYCGEDRGHPTSTGTAPHLHTPRSARGMG